MENSKEPAFTMLDPNSSFTKREYACIKLGVPKSGDPVIDDIIRIAERKRLAGLAMQGFVANDIIGRHFSSKEACERSIIWADELLRQLEK